LIWYGSIRQWTGTESEHEIGKARDQGVGPGGCQGLVVAGRMGVADGMGSGEAGGFERGAATANGMHG